MRCLGLGVLVLLAGCSRVNPLFEDTAGGSGTDSDATKGTTEGGPSDEAGEEGDEGEDSTVGSDDTGPIPDTTTEGETETNMSATDGPCQDLPGIACETFDELNVCPDGYKCAPIGNKEGYTGMQCVPVDDLPHMIGDACAVDCGPFSGIDDCESNAACLRNTDGFGTCHALCDPGTPFCEDASTACIGHPSQVFGVCMGKCNPLIGDCDESEVCVPTNHGPWVCLPDASGDSGGQHDACGAVNTCDPGYVCALGTEVGCADARCCTSVCDHLIAAKPCAVGLSCAPWRTPDYPGYEGVGYCIEGA